MKEEAAWVLHCWIFEIVESTNARVEDEARQPKKI
jgi:hypothetical protein